MKIADDYKLGKIEYSYYTFNDCQASSLIHFEFLLHPSDLQEFLKSEVYENLVDYLEISQSKRGDEIRKERFEKLGI